MNTTRNISMRTMSLDIIRGFSLFGMLIVHAAGFSGASNFLIHSLDYYLAVFNHLFFESKFVSIYSFLFGVGSHMFFSRTTQRGLHSYQLFSRRLITLLPIGIISILIVPQVTPILVMYSLLGFILVPFFKLQPKMILRIVVILASCNMTLMIGTMVYINLLAKSTISTQLTMAIAAFTHFIYYIFLIVSMCLLGLYVGKINPFQQASQQLSIVKRIHKISFSLSLPLIVGGLWVGFLNPNISENVSFLGIGDLASYPLSIFYVTSILILYNKNYFMYTYKPLSYVGRISLTAYVGHLILLKLFILLLGWTHGFTLVQSLVLVCIVFTILIIFSFVWMQKFQQGPLEKAWRFFTYGKYAPIKKPSSY
ncbi:MULTISPECIES: DUF418 domain-containing protein [unclassified Bacillus cereus group]|uniref:DUF418 domain-containing protein n=1 Tax=Bacillus cereus group TaxID=86661 RepID=UPI0007758129|nr:MULTISPECIES: DUF418 domain-containing protein [unclassified Bacillus cereus group]KXO04354.1 hypothetical protein AYK81_24540 [Bacillus thuringiensis]MDA2157707.1 DUF418 domain-containing protein [Bacillus cereus group sp. Bc253]